MLKRPAPPNEHGFEPLAKRIRVSDAPPSAGPSSISRTTVASALPKSTLPFTATKQPRVLTTAARKEPPASRVIVVQDTPPPSSTALARPPRSTTAARQPQVAESGIITSLSMTNFMCHKNLAFSFGPQMNFIIGHNGSGKSATLSALTIALGGKPASTGRATGLKSFIREGQRQSTVTIGIKNDGEDAYEFAKYGPTIFIERRFTDSTSAWKIMSHDRRVLATTRSELDTICDHLRIQVDNPINILTQDASRQYLSSSSPRDKYQAFMEGTQLGPIKRTFGEMSSRIVAFHKSLVIRKEGLKDLEDKVEEWNTRYEEAQSARNLEAKIVQIEDELWWAYVAEKQEQCETEIQAHKKLKRKLDKAVEKVTEAQKEQDAADAVLAEAQQQILDEPDRERQELDEVRRSIKTLTSEMHTIQVDSQEANTAMKAYSASETQLRARLDAETAKLEAESQHVLQEYHSQIVESQSSLDTLSVQFAESQATVESLSDARQRILQQGEECTRRLDELSIEVLSIERAMGEARHHARNALNVFGTGDKMTGLLEAISRLRWHGRPPLGPIGQYVTLREEHQQYAECLRSYLGHQMRAFVVYDARDQKTLTGLLRGMKMNNMVIITGEDLFDYTMGEPRSDVLTIMRALEITNEATRRVLINSSKIEQMGLAPTREEAQKLGLAMLAANENKDHRVVSADRYNVASYKDGGKNSALLEHVRQHDPRAALFRVDRRGGAGRLEELQRDLDAVRRKRVDVERERSLFDPTLRELTVQLQEANRTLDSIRRERHRSEVDIERLKDQVKAAAPVNVSGLEESLDNVQKEKERLKTQFAAWISRKHVIDTELLPPLRERERSLSTSIEEWESRQMDAQRQVEDASERVEQCRRNLQHYDGKKTELDESVKAQQAVVDREAKELFHWRKTAEEHAAVVAKPRSVEDLQVIKTGLAHQKALRRQKNGVSAEEIDRELVKARETLEEEREVLDEMEMIHESMVGGLERREAHWRTMRKALAITTNLKFQHHLRQRKFEGKLKYDHNERRQTLELVVRPMTQNTSGKDATVTGDDTNAKKKGTRHTNPKNLSGGEKSFSTLCFLLSLWGGISCSFHCMDEFDVFMDAVVRQVSMKLLSDEALASPKQFILISPLALNNFKIGPHMKVHRMDDPERGVTE